MPTIVTDIVNEIFRSQKRKQGFAQKLKEIPVASESEVSDGESLGSQSTISRASNASYASCASVASDFGIGMPKEEYFMWGIELSRSRDSTVLKLDEVNDSEERHMLLLKQAVLGVNAIKGERNLVEIHTTDFEDKEQRHPLVSLTLGQQDFANLDLCLNWGKTKIHVHSQIGPKASEMLNTWRCQKRMRTLTMWELKLKKKPMLISV